MKTKKSNRQHKMEEMMERAWGNLLFVGLPLFLGFMALAISLSLGFFIAGFVGVITVVKKETSSGWGTVRGPIAIVTGVLITILFWGIAAYFFFNGF
jgi:hypothetical protein